MSVARIGILTVSDRASRGEYEDKGGPAIHAWFKRVLTSPWQAVAKVIPDEQPQIEAALRRMMGHTRLFRRTIAARLTHDLKHQPGRTEFVRVTLAKEQGGYAATSTGAQGSGMLLSMARADGLMVVPAECAGLAAGEQVTVQLLDGTVFQDEAGFTE